MGAVTVIDERDMGIIEEVKHAFAELTVEDVMQLLQLVYDGLSQGSRRDAVDAVQEYDAGLDADEFVTVASDSLGV